MTGRAVIRNILGAALFACGAVASHASGAEGAAEDIAGLYDGSQMELAAQLELGADGRYRYGLSYGAIDEYSQGSWTPYEDEKGGGIALTSDPAQAPRFAFLGQSKQGEQGALTIHLDVPEGLPRSLFRAELALADGSVIAEDFSEGDLVVPLQGGDDRVSIRLALPIFEVVGTPSEFRQVAGGTLNFVFQPNDLGFRIFEDERFPTADGGFVMERYGRKIRFGRVER
jgi:hypothetical protein